MVYHKPKERVFHPKYQEADKRNYSLCQSHQGDTQSIGPNDGFELGRNHFETALANRENPSNPAVHHLLIGKHIIKQEVH